MNQCDRGVAHYGTESGDVGFAAIRIWCFQIGVDKKGTTRDAQVSAVAALDEPIRRRLYDYVVGQPDPVSRDQAAAALAVPHSTAAFHLNRFVDRD